MTRLILVVKELLGKNKDKTIVVVTHGGVIRCLLPFFLNLPKEESFNHDPKNGSLTIFDFDGEGFTKVLIDEATHLG